MGETEWGPRPPNYQIRPLYLSKCFFFLCAFLFFFFYFHFFGLGFFFLTKGKKKKKKKAKHSYVTLNGFFFSGNIKINVFFLNKKKWISFRVGFVMVCPFS